MSKIRFVVSCLLLIAFVPHLQAQLPFDSSFTTPGFYTTQSPYIISAAAGQPDGRMIVAGNFVRYNNQPSTNLVRLQPNGTLDATFDPQAKTDGTVTNIVVQADGKLLLGGPFSTFKNQFISRNVIRLNANGTLDNTFTAPENLRNGWSSIMTLAAQPDGKVLIWGYGVKAGLWDNALVRLNKDGTVDSSFHCETHLPPDENVFSIAAMPDGKLYVGGNFTSFSGQAKTHIARLLPNGTVDSTFTAPVFSHYNALQPIYITALLPLPDGALLAGGAFIYCGNFESHGVVRLKQDGSIDPAFRISNSVYSAAVTKLDTADGKVVAGGMFSTNSNPAMLIRFDNTGNVDPAFNNSAPDPGNTNSYNLMSFAVLLDHSITIGGSFSLRYTGKYYTGLAHFFADGRIDTALDVTFQQIGTVHKTVVLRNGKIMVAGNFNLYGTTPINHVVRLLPTGALDKTFQPGSGPDDIVTDIAETADSSLIIAGNFKNVNGHAANGVARLLPSGAYDTSFSVGAGPQNMDMIYSLMPQPDGKLLVGGAFGTFNNHASRGVVRLLADGAIDKSFTVPDSTPWYSVGSIALVTNNQILIGDNSDRTTYDFTTPLRVWRLNDNGSIDNLFQTQNVGGFPIAQKIGVSPQNKIYYSGEVLRRGYNSNGLFFTNGMLRLRQNGTTDSSAVNFPNTFYVSDFKVLGDSAILACGRNLGWNDSANYIMRFKPDLSIDSSFNPIAIYYNLKTLDCMPDGRIVAAGEPVRFFNFDVEQIPNIAVLKSPSLQVRQDTAVVNNITGTVNTGSTTQLKIVNTGNTPAALGNGSGAFAVIEGADAGSFSITPNRNITTLQKGDSLLLTIRYTPLANGAQTARITIPYNNGIRQRYTFTINGVSVVTAVPDVVADANTVVYPNPSNGVFYVKSDMQQYTLTVYDVLGRPVLQKEKLPARQLVQVWLKNKSKGMYWMRFATSKKVVVRQIVLQ